MDGPPPSIKNYLGEIVAWRISAAIFWAIISQCSIVVILHMLLGMRVDLWHPTTWLHNIVSLPMYMIPLGVVILVHSLTLCNTLNNLNCSYNKSRFAGALSICSIRNIICCAFHICIGGIFFWLYIKLLGGQLSSKCKYLVASNCLSEKCLYLTLCGSWIGICLFVKVHILESKIVAFPTVQQRKFFQVISEVKSTLVRAFYDSCLLSFPYIVIYYWFGDSVREFWCTFFQLSFEGPPLFSIGFMENIMLFLYSWFLCALFFFSIYILELLLKVFLKQHISFPVVETFSNVECATLHKVLTTIEVPIMYQLAHLDLMILAQRDRSRRQDLFSLSQPGGHPHNWNAIVDVCLNLINTFTNDLNMVGTDCIVNPIVDVKKQVTPPVATYMRPPVPGLRNLSVQQVDYMTKSPNNVFTDNNAQQFLKSSITTVKESLLKNSIIAYMFGELPEARISHVLFTRGQLVIWTTQSLALLVSASLEEDNYGVVQKDIPSIISALLQLKQSVDKLQKVGLYKKLHRNDKLSNQMKNSLRSAIKRSLYRITVTFGQYIKELPIASDFAQVQNFLMFKEG